MVNVGERVGAIRNIEENTVYLFGFGVYEGRIHNDVIGFPNPRILLDNGKHVWGFQCWWGAEETVKESLEGKQVVDVSMQDNNQVERRALRVRWNE